MYHYESKEEKNQKVLGKQNVDLSASLGFKKTLSLLEGKYYTFNAGTKKSVNKYLDEFYKRMLKLRNEK